MPDTEAARASTVRLLGWLDLEAFFSCFLWRILWEINHCQPLNHSFGPDADPWSFSSDLFFFRFGLSLPKKNVSLLLLLIILVLVPIVVVSLVPFVVFRSLCVLGYPLSCSDKKDYTLHYSITPN